MGTWGRFKKKCIFLLLFSRAVAFVEGYQNRIYGAIVQKLWERRAGLSAVSSLDVPLFHLEQISDSLACKNDLSSQACFQGGQPGLSQHPLLCLLVLLPTDARETFPSLWGSRDIALTLRRGTYTRGWQFISITGLGNICQGCQHL